METPISLFIYNRPDLVKNVLDKLAAIEFKYLYVFADGPRKTSDLELCNQSAKIVKEHIVYHEKKCILMQNEKNRGMVSQIFNGLNHVFSNHDTVLYLQDDQEINDNSYNFCNELLLKYKDNEKIGHVNLSNLQPECSNNLETSYFFSHFINVWGFGTWKRIWDSYDPQMRLWKTINQKLFLKKFFPYSRVRKSVSKMYELHCFNPDPWTWDYQWEFNCLNNSPISITPTVNLCRDIGFNREDSSHNSGRNPFENPLEKVKFPLVHPNSIVVNQNFDRLLYSKVCPSLLNLFFNKVKRRFSIHF